MLRTIRRCLRPSLSFALSFDIRGNRVSFVLAQVTFLSWLVPGGHDFVFGPRHEVVQLDFIVDKGLLLARVDLGDQRLVEGSECLGQEVAFYAETIFFLDVLHHEFTSSHIHC